jgi:hypothetical protein
MPIAINASNFALPARGLLNGIGAGSIPAPPAPAPAPAAAPPASLPPPPPPMQPLGVSSIFPGVNLPFPGIPVAPPPPPPPVVSLPPIVSLPPRPPIFVPPQIPTPKTATQLAQGAVAQLTNVTPAAVNQAINAIASTGLDGPGIMIYLQRKTHVRVVLDSFAQNWDQTTRTDFADAFRMTPDQNDAMDAIVSLAILNDKDLEAEVIAENTSQTSIGDLTDNRKIIWQYPPAGTVMQPPYVILVAVEYRDVATAESTLKAITDQLGNFVKGNLTLKVPKVVIPKLG